MKYLKSIKVRTNSKTLNNNQSFPVSRSRKEGLWKYLKSLMVSISLILLYNLSNAQSFTTWTAGPSSDWFANYTWAGGTNFACSCLAGNDEFRIIPPGNPSNPHLIMTRPHQSGSWSGTSQIVLGPSASLTVAPQMSITNGSNNFINACELPCAGAYGASNLTINTEALRPPQNITYTYNPNGSVTFNWIVTTDLPEAGYRLVIRRGATQVAIYPNKSQTSHTINCPEVGVYSFSTHNFVLPFVSSVLADVNLPGAPQPNGAIRGKVTTLIGDAPVSGVTVTAVLQNPGAINNSGCYPTVYTDVTDAQGDYVIPFIYWGVSPNMATFQVTPTLAGHGFNPGMTTTTLQAGNVDKIVNFKDITSFAISGTVTDILTCGLDSVYITATPGNVIPVYSTGDGTYTLIVPTAGTYQVNANYFGTSLGTQSIVVNSNTGNHNFNYTATDTIRGFVGAGCEEFIGVATVNVQSSSGCDLMTQQTNLSGYYEMVLPSRPIEVQVIGYNPGTSGLDMNTVLNAIDSVYMIDLDNTTTRNIIYRKPISIEIFGLPPAPCPAQANPVLNQGERYFLNFVVWESQGICLADTGYIAIQNNIGTSALQSTILDTIPVSNGVAQYLIIPGEPELAPPYQKTLSYTAFVDNQTVSQTLTAVVSGSRQRTATITTGAPTALPFLILRDPPGDLSSSFFQQDTTRSYSQSYSALTSGGVKIWAKAKVGVEIFSLKAWGQIGGALSIGGSNQTTEETLVEMTSSVQVSTSSDEDVVGADGDLIMGAAVNFIYGLADVRKFNINTCMIEKDTVLIFSPDTFATTFILTVDDIRNITIPGLEILANNPDTTEQARRKFRNEILLWEQTLQMNEDLKAEGLENPIDNYTISASAGPFTTSTTGAATSTKTLEFTQYIQGEIAAEAGLEIGGSGGSLGVDVTIRGEFGQSKIQSNTIATTTGFTFDDNDNGTDLISFDYGKDPVYNTPVFGQPLGRSSCPHEEGTQYIDLPTLNVPIPVKVIPSGNTATFTIVMGNNSESGNSRTYLLTFKEQSNEFGAIWRINGSQNPLTVTLAPGTTQNATITIERAMSSPYYSFEGLQFEFGPGPNCSGGLKKTAFISAYFASNCPNISLTSPSTGWLINENSADQIQITMAGYVLGSDIDMIKMRYALVGTNGWNNSNISIPGPNVIAPPATYLWDVSDVPDGLYNIRLELNCNETVNTSTRIQGRIDRKAPVVFGVAEPKDDLLHPGDKIAIGFKEDILCSALGNYYLRKMPQNQIVPAQILCDGRTVTVIPQVPIIDMYNQGFEVGLIAVEDLYGNIRTDTVIWEFVVSEPDTDGDGIPDTKDVCPGGDDKYDSDMDGLPDDCDCVPLIKTNGITLSKAAMDFDGVDDHIVIPYDGIFDPMATASLTFEAWVFPKAGTVSQTIISKGNGSNGNTSYIFAIYQNKIALFYGAGGSNATWIYSNTNVTFGTWSHVAVKFNDATNTFTFYLNGVEDGVRLRTQAFYADASPVYIGRQGVSCNCNYFLGKMDEVRFWETARSSGEIQSNMHMELSGNESGLKAYYNLNDGIPFGNNIGLSTSADQSGNGHDAAIIGFNKTGTTSNWVGSPVEKIHFAYELCVTCPDTINAALDFDGVNDVLHIPNHVDLIPTSSHPITLEAWIFRPATTVSFTDVIAYSAGNFVLASTNSVLQVFTGQNYFIPFVLPANAWTHLAFVFEPTTLKVYANGNLIHNTPFIHQSNNAGNIISLGGINGGTDSFLDGKMDDIRFWNTIRTQEEIQSNLYTELKGDEPGLVAYYNMNNGLPKGNNTSRTTVPDVTGNGHAATLVNFKRTGGYSNWDVSAMQFPDGDGDGLPDVCDDCFALKDLTLTNMTLDGTFRARETITLGSGISFGLNADVFLRAPIVKVMQPLNPGIGVNIEIIKNPCIGN